MYRKSMEKLDCMAAHPYHWLGGPATDCLKAPAVSLAVVASGVAASVALSAVGPAMGRTDGMFAPMPLPDLPIHSRSWGSRLSLRDLLGPHLLLLASEGAGRWRAAAEGMAARLGVRLVSHTLGGSADLCELGWNLASDVGLPSAGAVLVTPTGLICWRAPVEDDDPERTVARVLLMLSCVEDVAGHDGRVDHRYTPTGGTV